MAGPHVHVAVVVAGVHTHAHAHVTHVHDGWRPFVKVEGSSLNRVVTNCYDRSEKIEEALDDFWSQANAHPSALPTPTYLYTFPRAMQNPNAKTDLMQEQTQSLVIAE